MWRQCDLHTHTTPDDTRPASSPEDLVRGAIESGVDVMAVTDHDSLANVPIVVEAARGTSLVVIPGLEVTTNHGHLLALSPGDQGVLALQDFVARAGVAPGAVLDFHEVVSDAREGVGVNSGSFAETLLLIGGHVDQHGSLLAAQQPLDVSGQLSLATELDALEVVNDAIREEWLVSGIKQSNRKMPFLRGSDSHHVDDARRTTWLYLPATDLRAFLQALSVPESSIRFDAPGGSPRFVIETVAFEGGLHDGMTFRLSQRATALIGPPLSGKSLIIDAIRFVFGTHCDIPEIAEVCNARLRRALGEGSIVRVTGRAEAGKGQDTAVKGIVPWRYWTSTVPRRADSESRWPASRARYSRCLGNWSRRRRTPRHCMSGSPTKSMDWSSPGTGLTRLPGQKALHVGLLRSLVSGTGDRASRTGWRHGGMPSLLPAARPSRRRPR